MVTSRQFKLEEQIRELVNKDNMSDVQFVYTRDGEKWSVNVFTVNPSNGETFLMKSEPSNGANYELALERVLDYVIKHKKDSSSYTVEWTKKGENGYNTSYFYCTSMYDVLHKFYEGKDNPDKYTIFSIKLNSAE
jgi:hypothetical protein